MNIDSEKRASFGGSAEKQNAERAYQEVNDFMNRIDAIWDEYIIPRAIKVDIKREEGERVYQDDPSFLINKDSKGKIENSVVIWRMEPSLSVVLCLDPIVIQRDGGTINAYEVPNSGKLLDETYGGRLVDQQTFVIREAEEHVLDELADPLFEKEVKSNPIDIVAVAQLARRISLDKPVIYDWMSDGDEELL